VTVTGVRVGDLAEASIVSSKRFIELDASVWSNNTVRVMARNISATTFDLAAATLSVGVAKRRVAQAQAGTSAEFALAFTIDANRSLTFTLHEVYLALAKTPIEGPAGVEASFDFRAAFNATATRMMTAVLRNQQVAAEYA